MSMLKELVAEAVALGGGDLCAAGHNWQSIGGTQPCDDCPREAEAVRMEEEIGATSQRFSRPVYQCATCGEWDYGERGGPAHADCVRHCHLPAIKPKDTHDH
jgi:hypothetical protein